MSYLGNHRPSETRLFKPLKLGNATVQHRIVFAPLTRYRNDDDHAPLPLMETHYADRASVSGTLVISEATAMAQGEAGDPNNPAFVTDAQVEGWRRVIQGVHAKGSVYFQQLFAMGRASDPGHLAERGYPYRSSSAVNMPGQEVTPRAITEPEILETIQGFVDTAKRAIAAGADGVEIHSAHGYLLDQFLSDNVNQRTDRWGGSIENRSRLTLEVVKAVVAAVGAERVAIRLSPYAGYQGTQKTDTRELYSYLIDQLKSMRVPFAYLSLVEATGDPAAIIFGASEINSGKSLDFIMEAWDNLSPIIVAGGYQPTTVGWAVEERYKRWDVLVAFGRHFLANPDLVFRIKNEIPLNKYNRLTFYINKSAEGYNDYPFSQEFLETTAAAKQDLLLRT